MTKIQSKLIIAVGIAGVLFTAAIALGLNKSVLTADPKAGSGITINLHGRNTLDRDDFDAGPAEGRTEAGTICQRGAASARYADPAAACIAAYGEALATGMFERAMQYAAIGCQLHTDPANCRRVGGLPLVMGNAGVPVPAAFADEIKRIASFVCLSGARFASLGETDITGRECAYFARQLVLASDPEYAWALEPAARQFYEGMHDPARAARLYRASCDRLGYAQGCESLRELSQRVSLHELEEVTEILERETGEALAGSTRVQRVSVRDFHEVTDVRDRELGNGFKAAHAYERRACS